MLFKKPFLFIIVLITSFTMSQNLLVNPDAEEGTINGWTDPDGIWGPAAPITPYEGEALFWPVDGDLPYTLMYQDVELTSGNANNYFYLSGWMANWDQYPHDKATLAIAAFDSSGNQLLYLSREHRNPVWGFYTISSQLPENSKKVRVYLIATRYVGSDNDAYFDALSLLIADSVPEATVSISSENDANSIEVNDSLQLTASTTGSTDSAYSWSSSYDNIATVSDEGVVTAHSEGIVTIQAVGSETQAASSIQLNCYPSENYLIFNTPKENDEVIGGTNYEITWNTDASGEGILYFSSNDGITWVVQDTIPDISTDTIEWTTPDSSEALNNCILKISWDSHEASSPRFTVKQQNTPVLNSKFITGTNQPKLKVSPLGYIVNGSFNKASKAKISRLNGSKIISFIPKQGVKIPKWDKMSAGCYILSISDYKSSYYVQFIR